MKTKLIKIKGDWQEVVNDCRVTTDEGSWCEEKWCVVKEYPNYSVSNYGRLYNNKTERFVKTRFYGNGYVRATVYLDRSLKKTVLIHRLVAEAFVSNPDGKSEVNHKDGIKYNNYYDNLEWVTHSENQQHRFHVLKKYYSDDKMHDITEKAAEFHRKQVRCVNDGTVYGSILEASKITGIGRDSISLCARKKRESVKGTRWEFV